MISDSPPQEPPVEQAPGKPDNESDQKANAEKKDKKSLWKLMVTPVVLALLGLALLPLALSLYRRRRRPLLLPIRVCRY